MQQPNYLGIDKKWVLRQNLGAIKSQFQIVAITILSHLNT